MHVKALAAAVGAVLLAGTVMGLISSSPAGAATQTQTFTYTGAEQQFVVPPGVTSLDVVVVGGSGAGGTGPAGTRTSSGGVGARVQGSITVVPGSTLRIEVGGDGTHTSGGFNGGGFSAEPYAQAPGGGGGASDIRMLPCGTNCPGPAESLASRLVVAGGGGGGGATGNSTTATKGGNGGAGDHAGSGVGVNGGPSGGKNGTTTEPGRGGPAGPFSGGAGQDGALGRGGDGGYELGGGGAGGGGGGGYNGGGGGTGGTVDTSGTNLEFLGGGGGGGGGSLVPSGGSIDFPAATPASVTITYRTPAPTSLALRSSASPSRHGQSVTFTATVTSAAAACLAGTVDFGTLGSAPTSGDGVAHVSTAELPVGTSTIAASYTPTDAGCTASSATLRQTVTSAPTSPPATPPASSPPSSGHSGSGHPTPSHSAPTSPAPSSTSNHNASGLASTGAQVWQPLLYGIGLLVVGLALAFAGRGRRNGSRSARH